MTPLTYRICYTAQDNSKTIVYDDPRFLLGQTGDLYQNYGKDWKNPMWETPFDIANPPVIQLFTGVIDKTGKRIWEGDIVKWINSLTGVVEIIAGTFVISFPDQTDSGPIGFLQTNDIEKIGNIFENPELLQP